MLLMLSHTALINDVGLLRQADKAIKEKARMTLFSSIIDKVFVVIGAEESRDIYEPWNLLLSRASQDES